MAASPKNRPRLIKFWLPVVIWMGLIFCASSLPGSTLPSLFNFQDIAFHLAAYLILALFFIRALKNTRPGITFARTLIFTTVFSILYAITDEFHQVFVPGRTPSGMDVFIDSMGAVIGSLIYR